MMPTYTVDVISFMLGIAFGIILFVALAAVAGWGRNQARDYRDR